MIKHVFLSIFVMLLSNPSWAQSANANPYELVEQVANATFARMSDEWTTNKGDVETLKLIIREEMLPHVDYQFAAFKVLGKNFKSVPKAKLNEYVDTFGEYLVSSYSVALGYYDNQTVVFEPSRQTDDKKFVVVRGVIQGNQGPDIDIAFKVRKSGKKNQWKAYDLVAEGISLVDSKRAEFGAILNNGDIDDVLAVMNKTIAAKTTASLSNQ